MASLPEDKRRMVLDLYDIGVPITTIYYRLKIKRSEAVRVLRENGREINAQDNVMLSTIRHELISEQRTQLQYKLLADAEELRRALFAPTTVYAFAGKDGTFREAELDEAGPAEKRALAAALKSLVDSVVRLQSTETGIRTDVLNLIKSTADHLGLGDDGD